MSDSTICPVTTSSVNEVDPRTRSRSGRLANPITLMLSSSSGEAWVKPANWDDIAVFGTASHVAKARPTASRNCCAETPGTSRLLTKYRMGKLSHFRETTLPPTVVPSFRYACA